MADAEFTVRRTFFTTVSSQQLFLFSQDKHHSASLLVPQVRRRRYHELVLQLSWICCDQSYRLIGVTT